MGTNPSLLAAILCAIFQLVSAFIWEVINVMLHKAAASHPSLARTLAPRHRSECK